VRLGVGMHQSLVHLSYAGTSYIFTVMLCRGMQYIGIEKGSMQTQTALGAAVARDAPLCIITCSNIAISEQYRAYFAAPAQAPRYTRNVSFDVFLCATLIGLNEGSKTSF